MAEPVQCNGFPLKHENPMMQGQGGMGRVLPLEQSEGYSM